MNLRAVYLLYEWYSAGCLVSFTGLLALGYCQVDYLTLPVYCICFVSVLLYWYRMVHVFVLFYSYCMHSN